MNLLEQPKTLLESHLLPPNGMTPLVSLQLGTKL
jgi:hypothetical protein